MSRSKKAAERRARQLAALEAREMAALENSDSPCKPALEHTLAIPQPWVEEQPELDRARLTPNGYMAMSAILLMVDGCVDEEEYLNLILAGDRRGADILFTQGVQKFVDEYMPETEEGLYEPSLVDGLTVEQLRFRMLLLKVQMEYKIGLRDEEGNRINTMKLTQRGLEQVKTDGYAQMMSHLVRVGAEPGVLDYYTAMLLCADEDGFVPADPVDEAGVACEFMHENQELIRQSVDTALDRNISCPCHA